MACSIPMRTARNESTIIALINTLPQNSFLIIFTKGFILSYSYISIYHRFLSYMSDIYFDHLGATVLLISVIIKSILQMLKHFFLLKCLTLFSILGMAQTCDIALTGYTPPPSGSGLHTFTVNWTNTENCGCNEFTQWDGNECEESTSTHVQNNESITHIVFGIHYVNEERVKIMVKIQSVLLLHSILVGVLF